MVTKEDVKRTLDCVYIRKQIKFASILFVIFELILLITLISEYSGDIKATLFSIVFFSVVVVLFFGVPIICLLCKYRSIVNNYEKYDEYEVVLDTPKWVKFQGGIRSGRAYRYIVTFTTKNNQTITTKTRALWSDGALQVFDKFHYDGRKVKILYDEQKDKVYVLGKTNG